MKSKAPLVLMEQLVMLLVFALAAALCVQAFALSDRTSAWNAARDRAVLEAQNAAEALKGNDTDYFTGQGATGDSVSGWYLSYDAQWQPVRAQSGDDPAVAYHLMTFPEESRLDYLWCASVQVYTAEGDLLVSLPVAGQITEVMVYG